MSDVKIEEELAAYKRENATLMEDNHALRADNDALRAQIDTFGLQPARPTPPVRSIPRIPPHGTLKPTNGATGRTEEEKAE